MDLRAGRREQGSLHRGQRRINVLRRWVRFRLGERDGSYTKKAPAELPPIRLFEQNGKLYSVDNRRLFAGQYAGVKLPYRMATPGEIAARNQTQIFDGTSIMIRFPGGRENWGWWQQ